MKYVKKQGEHGVLYKYAIRYTDSYNEWFGEGVWRTYAYNMEDALDKFYDEDDGFEAVSDPKRMKMGAARKRSRE